MERKSKCRDSRRKEQDGEMDRILLLLELQEQLGAVPKDLPVQRTGSLQPGRPPMKSRVSTSLTCVL